MKDSLDSSGKPLYITDLVKYRDADAIIQGFTPEGLVSIVPMGPGIPSDVDSKELTQVESFFFKLRELRSDQEIQALLSSVEEGLSPEEEKKGKKGSGSTTKQEKVQVEF